jgi:hypothetical protein
MSAGITQSHASRAQAPKSLAHTLDQAYRIYRRRIDRCSTVNQLNRVHIAVENYMTPMEVRHFRTGLLHDAPDSASHRWTEHLVALMPVNKRREAEFERRSLCKGATWYTANGNAADRKTLILCFAGHFHRPMVPIPWLLDCLNPALYDVVVLRDFARLYYALGIPGLGADFFSTLSALRAQIDPGAYRNAISLGTSGGGLLALLAAIQLGLRRGVSVSAQDLQKVTAKLLERGVSAAPYAALLASRPDPFPELILVCGANNATDVLAASALQAIVPCDVWKVRNCADHALLAWQLARGTLPAHLAEILGQSLEQAESAAPAAAVLTKAKPSSTPAASPQRLVFDSGQTFHMTIKPNPKS